MSNFKVKDTVFVSVFNRFRNGLPYCKPFIIVAETRTHYIVRPYSDVENVRLDMRFCKRHMKSKGRNGFEYQLWESIEAFRKAEMEGYYAKAKKVTSR